MKLFINLRIKNQKMEKTNPVLIDEEFNKEINTQIELVTKLEKVNLHVKNDQLLDDLYSN